MISTPQFNRSKALHALLYIMREIANGEGVADKYATLKILYFAEKKHLLDFGQLITDDRFAALKYGPVPSNSDDLLDASPDAIERIDNKRLRPLADVNPKYLSKSDVACLTEAIAENKALDFNGLKDKSHDPAFHEAFDNDIHWMSLESIAAQDGATAEMLQEIKERYDLLHYAQCARA